MPRLALAALPLALAFAASAAPSDQQQQPEQQSATISNRDRVVITGMVPIPDVGEGAPRFTSKDLEGLEQTLRKTQTDVEHDFRSCHVRGGYPTCNDAGPLGDSANASMACEREYAIKAANLAVKAEEVTREAEEVRRAAMVGQATQAEVEAAELKRQEAVNKVQVQRKKLLDVQANIGLQQKLKQMGRKTIDYVDIAPFIADREKANWGLGLAMPDTPEGLSISDVKATQVTDKKGDYVLLQGKINNKLSRSVPVPPLQASVVDDRGTPLYVTSVEPDNWNPKVRANNSYAFGFEIRPAPQAMTHAIVAFASKANPPPRLHMTAFCGGAFSTSQPTAPEFGSSGVPGPPHPE